MFTRNARNLLEIKELWPIIFIEMNKLHIPFQLTDWANIPVTEHPGESGIAYWQSVQFGDLRIRIVAYSAGYRSDHWCDKGHIIYCIDGEMTTRLTDGSEHTLRAGMTYQVSDNLSRHSTYSTTGVKLFIIDGGFLG